MVYLHFSTPSPCSLITNGKQINSISKHKFSIYSSVESLAIDMFLQPYYRFGWSTNSAFGKSFPWSMRSGISADNWWG